jgi:hypothetical protein
MLRICLLIFRLLSIDANAQDVGMQLLIKNSKWRDSSDMQFNIQLFNLSSSPQLILDQVLDDVYTDNPGILENLTFSAQKLENGIYVDFRDRPFVNSLGANLRTRAELLDSIKKIRNPYIKLNPHDTLYVDYSFRYGRLFKRGKYRIKALFTYDLTKDRKTVESDWVYFEVMKDYLLMPPFWTVSSDQSINLFWRRKR